MSHDRRLATQMNGQGTTRRQVLRASATAAFAAFAGDWVRADEMATSGPAATTAHASGEMVVFPAGVAVVCGVDEPAPLRRAVADLLRDLKAVLGRASPHLTDEAAVKDRPAIIVTCQSAATAAYRDGNLQGREAHGLAVQAYSGSPRLVLKGADVRGTIYAVYECAERLLGIPPTWFWTGWRPQHLDSIRVPANLDLTFGPATVHWRAWFPNDTDLFGPWSRSDPAHLDALYETMLRLKLNCVEGVLTDNASMNTPYSAAADIRAARDRGLAFCGHHVTVFGAAYGQWNAYWTRVAGRDRVPKLAIRQTDDLTAFWRYHIQTAIREKIECVWIIGFRGNGDQPFWQAFSDAPADDQDRADVIASMMRRQIDLLKAETGDPTPDMRVTLYNENSDFVARGLLKPPETPTLTWSFVAARRDHFPPPDLRTAAIPPHQPVGYYFNCQFTSTGCHLVPGEGPWKMEANFRYAREKAGRPLRFCVVNMGNIREFAAEGAAAAALLWDFNGYNTDTWLRQFCVRNMGAENAQRVDELIRRYYAAYWSQRAGDLPGFGRQYIFQDLRIQRAGLVLLRLLRSGTPDPNPFDDGKVGWFRIVAADNGEADTLSAVQKGVQETVTKLQAINADIETLRPLLPESSQPIFDNVLRTPTRIFSAANEWLLGLARATAELGTDPVAVTRHVAEANAAIGRMREATREAETDLFQGWYNHERLWGINARAAETSKLLADLRSRS